MIDTCHHPLWCHRLSLTASLISLNDYILNIVCFGLFVHKLRQLIITKLKSELNEFMDDSIVNQRGYSNSVADGVNQALDHNRNNQLLNLITKQTIIGTLVVFANQSFATGVFIIDGMMPLDVSVNWTWIVYLLRGVECAFICFLLYLGLGINTKEYEKVCKCCHGCCYNLCVKLTTKTIKDSVATDDYLLMDNLKTTKQ